jgi:hypothetical protein
VLVRTFDHGILFGVAVDAAKEIKASPRDGGQRSALVSIIFSVAAIEAFINEITELALDFIKFAPRLDQRMVPPQSVVVFAEVMSDAERAHATLESKFTLAHWALPGRKLDRGTQPCQDFASLVRLRNGVVHLKASESVDHRATQDPRGDS